MLFARCKAKGLKSILKGKCTPAEVIVDKTKTVNSRLEGTYDICYLPDVKCIAISYWRDHVVKAIHCETGEQLWEVKGEVAAVTWKPHGLCYSPKHQSLLVCDKGRLAVLNPRDGSLLQTIPLPFPCFPLYLSLYKGNIIMWNRIDNSVKISVFAINLKYQCSNWH